jgi:hypothetical protein
MLKASEGQARTHVYFTLRLEDTSRVREVSELFRLGESAISASLGGRMWLKLIASAPRSVNLGGQNEYPTGTDGRYGGIGESELHKSGRGSARGDQGLRHTMAGGFGLAELLRVGHGQQRDGRQEGSSVHAVPSILHRAEVSRSEAIAHR